MLSHDTEVQKDISQLQEPLKFKISIERATLHVTFISFYRLFNEFFLRNKNGIRESDGMRDSCEKGAGRREQDPHPHYRRCIRNARKTLGKERDCSQSSPTVH